MTVAHFTFEAGSKIHEHSHSKEEVWTVIEGELEVTVDALELTTLSGRALAGMLTVFARADCGKETNFRVSRRSAFGPGPPRGV